MKLINPAHLRRLMPAALLAAAATLGGTAVGDPATAYAVPEWDIGNYDACVAKVNEAEDKGEIRGSSAYELRRECCLRWGGIAQPTPEGGFLCVAPPADAQQGPGQLPGVATQTLAPAPPPIRNPDVVTQTFTPAPASPG